MTSASVRIKVLFVCLGNICRSPTAEGVFTDLVNRSGLLDRLEIDSSGTISYHAGNPPDQRAQKTAVERGYDISHLRARQIKPQDCEYYDYILVMDEENLSDVQGLCPGNCRARINLFLDYASGREGEQVPDPYSGSAEAFDRAIGLIEMASKGLLEHIVREHRLS